MKAFNDDKQLKKDLVAEALKHQKADEIIQGTYGNDKGWCAVGCTIQSYNDRRGKSFKTGDHAVYENELGIPRIIARLEDRFFEGMAFEDAKGFPVKFLQAITPGADLSLVWYKFIVWMLADKTDGVIKFTKPEGKKAIKQVVKLYEKHIAGEKVDLDSWRSARNAAAAAYAADAAAYAADAAAYAAAAAADAAAYAAAAADAAAAAAYAAAAAAAAADAAAADAAAAAAYAAAAAAYAADAAAYAAAAAADAARKIHYKKMADKLLELLAEAK